VIGCRVGSSCQFRKGAGNLFNNRYPIAHELFQFRELHGYLSVRLDESPVFSFGFIYLNYSLKDSEVIETTTGEYSFGFSDVKHGAFVPS